MEDDGQSLPALLFLSRLVMVLTFYEFNSATPTSAPIFPLHSPLPEMLAPLDTHIGETMAALT